jgi:Tfp pilus assembly protein PilF
VQAETALRKAIQIDPNYAAAQNNLAVIYLSQKPPLVQLARWHYQKALDAGQPRNPDLEKALAGETPVPNP